MTKIKSLRKETWGPQYRTVKIVACLEDTGLWVHKDRVPEVDLV
jgi:hypothetical protein